MPDTKTGPIDEARLLTVREAADRLKLSPSTVQKLADSGALQVMKTPGGHRRIAQGSVEAYLQQASSDSGWGGLGAGTKRSIVVVDDDPLVREMLEHVLRENYPQFEVLTAADGLEAVMQIERKRPILLITDLGMKFDGFRLLRMMRERPEFREIRLAVITGLSDKQIKARGPLASDVALFRKPLNIERFHGYMAGVAQSITD